MKFIKSLPLNICIPAGFIIDDYIRITDIDGNGVKDFVAVKYNKREDDQIDGDLTFWSFYMRNGADSIYRLNSTLSNLVPPYIKDMSYDYLLKNPLAAKLFEEYPQRMSHRLSFMVNVDTIRLSYKFQDAYGKSFVFVYDATGWYLENIEYFIGELPIDWWNENSFYYSLNDKIKIIESRKPKQRISITNFDLKVAFKYREEEWSHLAEWHVDGIDTSKFSSIDEVHFEKCARLDLPDDWMY